MSDDEASAPAATAPAPSSPAAASGAERDDTPHHSSTSPSQLPATETTETTAADEATTTTTTAAAAAPPDTDTTTTTTTPQPPAAAAASAPKPPKAKAEIPIYDSAPSKAVTSDVSLLIPKACIKRIMKLDPDTKQLNQDAIVLVAKATELFIDKLARASHTMALTNKRKTIKYEDIADARVSEKSMEFLDGVIPQI